MREENIVNLHYCLPGLAIVVCARLPRRDRQTADLLATVTLLAGDGSLAMRGRRGVLRRGLRGGRFPLGRVFGSDTGGRMFVVCVLTHTPLILSMFNRSLR